MNSIRRVSLATAISLCLYSMSGQAQDAISASAQQQVADIIAVKRTLTPAQKKIASSLVFATKVASGDPSVASVLNAIPLASADDVIASGNPAPTSETLSSVVTVDIYGTIDASVLDAITAAGGTIKNSAASFGIVQASLPLGSLEALAANPNVSSIVPTARMSTNVGALTSQGYIAQNAKVTVQQGIDGTGVTVGVMSDSAKAPRVAALIASGDLGANTQVLTGQAGPSNGSDEGAAMMEIVQDMAPGAKIIFATAFNGIASFVNNIIALQAAGCRVIVDDVSYFNEGAFQDGPIARAVNQVTAAGVVYVSSAANSGSLTMGTSGTWEGDFVSAGPVTSPVLLGLGETGLVHNFGTAATPQAYDVLTGTTTFISLKWSDPLAASTNDYDLFIFNSTGTTLKGFSAAAQTGTQDPYEAIGQGTNCGTASASGYCPAVGDRIVVVLYDGVPRAMHVDTSRGRLSINTSGSTYGHNAGLNTVSTAATYWNSARTGTRPFTGAANPIETFSSDGPRKIFYQPNGTPITPGNFLFGTNGGTTLQKPDVTGTDGNSTKTPGFLPFFGTSAASPHIAGIAALVLQAAPWATADQVKAALRGGTVDNMAPGVDRDSGYGITMAPLAVQYVTTH